MEDRSGCDHSLLVVFPFPLPVTLRQRPEGWQAGVECEKVEKQDHVGCKRALAMHSDVAQFCSGFASSLKILIPVTEYKALP